MAWSTRQLADLAGVTVRAIRHWHDIGLLEEPTRRSNGYKQYGASHLVLALRIARLASLGFTLEAITTMLSSEEQGRESLRALRAELDDKITELSGLRDTVDGLIERGASPDLSPEAILTMEALGSDPASRNVAVLLARLLPEADLPVFVTTMRAAPESLEQLNAELLQLPHDTPDAAIDSLAKRGIALLDDFLNDREVVLRDIEERSGAQLGSDSVTDLVLEHMNRAQQRAMTLIIEGLMRSRGAHDGESSSHD